MSGPIEKWSDIDSDDCVIENNGDEEVDIENKADESEFARLGVEYNRSLYNYPKETNEQLYASPAYYQDPNTVPTTTSSRSALVDRIPLGRSRSTPSPSVSFANTPNPFQIGIGSTIPSGSIPGSSNIETTPNPFHFGIASTLPTGTNYVRPPTGRAFTTALQKVLKPPLAPKGVLSKSTVAPLAASSFLQPNKRPTGTRSLSKSKDASFAPLVVSSYVPLTGSLPPSVPRKTSSYDHDEEPSQAELDAAYNYAGSKTQKAKRTKK